MIEENSQNGEISSWKNIPNPVELVQYLDRFVIGQEEAKKTLSVAVYNHYKRVLWNTCRLSCPGSSAGVSIDKSNVLLAGHTGTGKTHMLKTISKAIGLPCYIGDATKITESGYVGDDVETLIVGLLRECDYDIRLAEMSIIAIDEIDKIGRRGENASITRDVGGEGVQQGLLKIVEGGVIGVPPNGGRKHPEQKLLYVDTSNILFIGMGAFDGLDRIVERRVGSRSVGFNTEKNTAKCDDDLLSMVTPDDLKRFGMIPELIGRFPIFTHTNDLSTDDMKRILKETENSIVKQYQTLFSVDDVALIIDDDALTVVANAADSMGTGARGLRTIMESVLMDATYSIFDGSSKPETLTITADDVRRSINKKGAA